MNTTFKKKNDILETHIENICQILQNKVDRYKMIFEKVSSENKNMSLLNKLCLVQTYSQGTSPTRTLSPSVSS